MIIITTVGTSLLTNLIKDEYASFRFDIGDSLRKAISTGKLNGESSDVESAISNHLEGNDKYPKDEIYGINLNASAEIKSICKIADGKPAIVYLLATDTFMSEYAAKQIQKHLNKKKNLVLKNPIRITDLDVDHPDDFEQAGFEKLIGELEQIRDKHPKEQFILNISGGYKALIPFLTIYAQLRNVSVKYIYENSDKLISIDKAPLDFDWEIIEQHYFALESFGDNRKAKPPIEKLKERLLDTEFEKLRDEYRLITDFQDNEGVERVRLTVFGDLYLKIYDEKFHSGEFNRKSLHSKLIEYLVYEYYQDKFPEAHVKCGYRPDESDYDIDVFIESEDEIIAIEVKPAGNIPIRSRGKKDDHDTIEYKLSEGSFSYIANLFAKKKNIKLTYVCYGPNGIHSSPIEQVRSLLQEGVFKTVSDKQQSFELNWLKTPSNFKANTNWKIDSNYPIKPILSYSFN